MKKLPTFLETRFPNLRLDLSRKTGMDLIELVASNFADERGLLLVTGRIELERNQVKIYPNPDDNFVSYFFADADVVEGPLEFESTIPLYDRPDVAAIKVKRGCEVTVTKNHRVTSVTLLPPPGRPANLCAFPTAQHTNTWCGGMLEFECDTNNFLGPCLGVWMCP